MGPPYDSIRFDSGDSYVKVFRGRWRSRRRTTLGPVGGTAIVCQPMTWELKSGERVLEFVRLRRGSRIQKGGGGFVQEFRLENRSYPDVHDFSLRMQVIIANDIIGCI